MSSAEGPDRSEYSIGELARELAVALRAIRFYEDPGRLAPRRVRRK